MNSQIKLRCHENDKQQKTGLSVWMAGCEQSEVKQARRARRSGQVFTLAFLIVGRKTGAADNDSLHHTKSMSHRCEVSEHPLIATQILSKNALAGSAATSTFGR